jgi:hypothetical protein
MDVNWLVWVGAGLKWWKDQLDALWVQAQSHWRAYAGGQQPMGLVVKLHGKSHQALQQGSGTLYGLLRIARVDGIDQVRNQFAIVVGAEVVTPALQLAAQSSVVEDASQMQNGHARA